MAGKGRGMALFKKLALEMEYDEPEKSEQQQQEKQLEEEEKFEIESTSTYAPIPRPIQLPSKFMADVEDTEPSETQQSSNSESFVLPTRGGRGRSMFAAKMETKSSSTPDDPEVYGSSPRMFSLGRSAAMKFSSGILIFFKN